MTFEILNDNFHICSWVFVLLLSCNYTQKEFHHQSVLEDETEVYKKFDTMNDEYLNIPFGIADLKNGKAYLQNSEGYIKCINLYTGKVYAASEFKGNILTIDKGTLYGWSPEGHTNEVKIFAAEINGILFVKKWETKNPLPEWISIADYKKADFQIVGIIKENTLDITWQAENKIHEGTPPPMKLEQSQIKKARKSVQLNLKNGDLVYSNDLMVNDSQLQDLPRLKKTQKIVPYKRKNAWHTKAWFHGSIEHFVMRQEGVSDMILVQRDTAGNSNQMQSVISSDPSALASVTNSGEFVLVQEPSYNKEQYQVFGADDGKQLFTIPHEDGTSEVVITDNLIFYTVIKDERGKREYWVKCRSLDNIDHVLWSTIAKEEILSIPKNLPGGMLKF